MPSRGDYGNDGVPTTTPNLVHHQWIPLRCGPYHQPYLEIRTGASHRVFRDGVESDELVGGTPAQLERKFPVPKASNRFSELLTSGRRVEYLLDI
jgi:hypothetical protein